MDGDKIAQLYSGKPQRDQVSHEKRVTTRTPPPNGVDGGSCACKYGGGSSICRGDGEYMSTQ